MPILLAISPPEPIWIWVGVVAGIATAIIGVAAKIASILRAKFGPTWRLRQRVTNWLVDRRWILKTEASPNLYFGLWASELDNPQKEILICRTRDHKDILAFSARVPLDPAWIEPLSTMPEASRGVLVQEMGIFISTMRMAFIELEWPFDKLAIQHAIPIDNGLSAYTVDLEAKAVLHGIFGARRIIRKALIQLPQP